MAHWDDGYVTDTVYTSQFQREATPGWLAMTALLLGQRPPDLSRPFRYADFGCGNGFTALTVAATCPHAKVWGFDFNPAHIETARALADRAGLTNIRFVEASFAELATQPDAATPEFDFIVAHGVLSWISLENQYHLVAAIGRRLVAGGLCYISYNVTTGIGNMLPLRTLMRLLRDASSDRSDQAAGAILDQLDQLRLAGATFFQQNPTLENRLKDVRAQDPRYVAHEYLNRDWRPMMFAEVADAMAEAKCRFVGSAMLVENIDSISVPAGMAPLLAQVRDPRMRETLRDIGAAQEFRRDVYRRGFTPTLVAEQQAAIDALAFGWTGLAVDEQVTIVTTRGTVIGKPALYKPLLVRLQAGPATVRQLHATLPPNTSVMDLLQALSLLAVGGHIHPLQPSSVGQAAGDSTRGLNQAIIAVNTAGGDLRHLVSPVLGTALRCDLLETQVIGALLDGTPAEVTPLAREAIRRLALGDRAMLRDGQAVTDPDEALRMACDAVGAFLGRRLRVWRALEVLQH